MAWTEKMVEMAIRLFDEGMSASRTATLIAEQSGERVTRNSVIGKWYRMGLFRAGKRPKYGVERRPRTSLFPPSPDPGMPAALARRVNNLRRLHLEMDKAAAPALPEPKVEEVASLWLPLADLPSNGCRWPNQFHPGDEKFAFCGLPQVEGRSYCGAHCRRAFTSPQAYMPKRPLFENKKRAAA